jgi:hypothetical protein
VDTFTTDDCTCPVCGSEGVSPDEQREREIEGRAAAREEWQAHGSPDDATYDPHTGWSAHDYGDTFRHGGGSTYSVDPESGEIRYG